MSRVNPLYVLLLLVVLLTVLIWQDRKIEERVVQEERRLVELERLGKRVVAMKNYWGDRKLQERRINQFVNFVSRFIKKREKRGGRLKLSLAGIGAHDADRIVSKLLNSFLKVGNLTIERSDREKISMEVELLF